MFGPGDRERPTASHAYGYEVTWCEAGRWIIDSELALKSEAVARARFLLSQGQGDAVKVVRYRAGPGGTLVTTEVLNERRHAAKAPTFQLTGDIETAPACRTLVDLDSLAARMALGALFRRNLTEQEITPSELLYDWRHLRRLLNAERALGPALNRVAERQGGSEGLAERRAALQRLLDLRARRTQALHAQRGKLPRLRGSAVASASASIRERFTDGDHDEIFRLAVCDRLAEENSLAAKLDVMLGLIAQNATHEVEPLLEGLLADCLGFPAVLSGFFPAAPRLADFLDQLADLLKGNALPESAKPAQQLTAIGYLLAAGRAPACRAVLLDRLGRELGGAKPLDRHDPRNEARCLESLQRALRLGDGSWLGGEPTRTALARRRRRLRETSLRQIGLESTADATGLTAGSAPR